MKSPRVNVSFEAQRFEHLKKMAKLKKKSVSSIVSQYVDRQIDLEDEMWLSQVADEALSQTKSWHSHEEVWGTDA